MIIWRELWRELIRTVDPTGKMKFTICWWVLGGFCRSPFDESTHYSHTGDHLTLPQTEEETERQTSKLFSLKLMRDSLHLAWPQIITVMKIMVKMLSAPLNITCDASDFAVGGVLQQCIDNIWQPLSFFSKKLWPAETCYSAFDWELLAVYATIRHFRHNLEGREQHWP